MSQFLPIFIYPLGVALVCLGFIFFLSRKPFVLRSLCVVAFVVLFVGGNRYVSDQLLWQLEKQFPPLETGIKANVIVVLGGVTKPPMPYRVIPEIGEGGDRLTYAAHLYKEGRAPYILVSGGRVGSHTAEADSMASFLMMLGVPNEVIIREIESRNTEENAINSKKLMLENGFENSLLVTSAAHMRRASKIFGHQNIKHTAAPIDYRTTGLTYYWPTDTLPEARHLEKTTGVIKEYLGYLYLKLKGY